MGNPIFKIHKVKKMFFRSLFLAAVSCAPPAASHLQLNLPDREWDRFNRLEMVLPVPDNTARYKTSLDVRLSGDYAHAYLSLVVARSGPADTLWFSLNPDKAIRSGQFLDYRFDLDTVGFHTHTPFCNWRLSHNMPERTLHGIVSVGLTMKKDRHGQR